MWILYDLPSNSMEQFVGGCELSFILTEGLEWYDSETCRQNVSNSLLLRELRWIVSKHKSLLCEAEDSEVLRVMRWFQ